MNNTPVEIIVAAFPTPDGAGRGMQELQRIKKEGFIGIEDMAIIVKDAEGKTKITNSKHRSAKGFLTGGIVGAIIGVLAGPAALVAAGGGAIGALAGRIRNHPIKTALKDVGDSLIPNSSAIIAVIEQTWIEDCERALAAAGARIAHETLKADITQQLEAGGNVLYSASATETGASAGRAAQSPQGTSISGVTSTGTTTTSGGRMAASPEGILIEHATLTDEKLAGGAAVATEAGAAGARGSKVRT